MSDVQRQCEEFNEKYQIGTKGRLLRQKGKPGYFWHVSEKSNADLELHTTHAASVLDGEAIIRLAETKDSYPLECFLPIKNDVDEK